MLNEMLQMSKTIDIDNTMNDARQDLLRHNAIMNELAQGKANETLSLSQISSMEKEANRLWNNIMKVCQHLAA